MAQSYGKENVKKNKIEGTKYEGKRNACRDHARYQRAAEIVATSTCKKQSLPKPKPVGLPELLPVNEGFLRG